MKTIITRLLLAVLISVLGFGPALAATTPNSVVTAQTPNRAIVQFLQGTDVAGTYKTLYTASSNGSKVVGLFSTNNDATATHLITCQVVNTAVKYGGVSITSVLNAGFANATPPQNLMASGTWTGLPVDSDGNPFFYMVSGDTLQCTFATALTAADVINIVAVTADF